MVFFASQTSVLPIDCSMQKQYAPFFSSVGGMAGMDMASSKLETMKPHIKPVVNFIIG